MNVQTLATSRRELLRGAIVASAAFAVPAAAVVPDVRKWHHAVALEQSTRNAFDIYWRDYVGPAHDRLVAVKKSFGGAGADRSPAQKAQQDATGYDRAQAQFDDLVDVHHKAFVALFLTPAPTVAAIALKLDLFAKDESWDYSAVGEMIGAMQSDAIRLSLKDR